MPPRRLHDRYFKQAKRDGYLARSAYKLIEIDQRHKILRPGLRVLDLGCSPGSWLQVAADAVTERGMVVGIDLKPVRAPMPSHVRTIEADAYKIDPAELIALATPPNASPTARPRAFDVLLSDMAPDTSGHDDDLRSAHLCRQILALAPALLRHGGSLAMKIFEGAEYAPVLAETRAVFDNVKGLKPDATRSVSREMYIVAKGFRAAAPEQTQSQEERAP